MTADSRVRHIAKAVTWRLLGTLDTILLSWFITGSGLTGLKIGAAEVATKLILYYFHERAWFNFNLGPDGVTIESKKRHLLKTFTWRVVGTGDTMILSWLISGNPLTGVKIGLAEWLTKMILYYVHERVWYRMNFGLPNRQTH